MVVLVYFMDYFVHELRDVKGIWYFVYTTWLCQ